jgi:four helix bundle protein
LAGTENATALCVVVRHFKELQCWRLANELRTEVDAICAMPAVAKHLRFCDSFQEAAGSICRNIAEGFDRFESTELARFFRYALGSLAEVQDHFEECLTRKFSDRPHFDRIWDLAEHTKATTRKFMAPHAAASRRQRRRQARRT